MDAVLHLHGLAQQWYMRLEQGDGTPPWRRFSELLNMHFGPPLRSNPLGELAACHRTSTGADYQHRFLALLTRTGPLNDSQKIQLFRKGLLEPMSIDVEMKGAPSLEVAMSLARAFERCEQVVAQLAAPPRAQRPPPTRGLLALPAPASVVMPALPAPTTAPGPAPCTITVAGRTVCRLSPAKIEECRENGQCFNCDEHYVQGHNRVCRRLFLLEIDDADSSPEDEANAETPHIATRDSRD